MYHKYIAECIGAFTLSFVVLIAASTVSGLPLPIPVLAGLTLALFVYSIGPISGCHINPSVTIAQFSVKKISTGEALHYIIAQFLGAIAALALAKLFVVTGGAPMSEFDGKIFLAEMVGAFFFNFGIAAVVYGKAKEQMSGFVVGGSLTLGVLVASLAGAPGILNPAVAFALNSITMVTIFAPIAGAVLGFQAYRMLVQPR